MSQILNCREHANHEEVHYLTTLLPITWWNDVGRHLQFTAQEIRQNRDNLSTKMVQIQLGDDVRLRIIGAAPCISNSPEPNRSARFMSARFLPPADTRLQVDEKL